MTKNEVLTVDHRQSLVYFNQMIDKLSDFKMFKRNKVGFIIYFGKPTKNKSVGPTFEEVSSFVLHYRKFFQEKDDISYKKIEQIYSRFSKKEYFQRFQSIRNEIEIILNDETSVTTGSHKWTKREVHDILIKGNLSHIQSKNSFRMKYLEICGDPLKSTIFNVELSDTLFKVFKKLTMIKKLNEEIINNHY